MIQARGHSGSAPHPSTTCSITHTNIRSLLNNQCFFFFLSTVRTATSSQTQSWQRSSRVYWVVAPQQIKNNRVQLQIREQTCAGIFDGTGLCLSLHSSGCLYANFCCLVEICPSLYCQSEPLLCQLLLFYVQYCDCLAATETVFLIKAIFSNIMYCPFSLPFPDTNKTFLAQVNITPPITRY